MGTAQIGPGPHGTAEALMSGPSLDVAGGALILLHGRGGSARDSLALGQELRFNNVSLLAPQAAGNTWYPNSFLAPVESNEPWLSSALALLKSLRDKCVANGIGADRIGIVGFSQGACLACEFVARYPQRYAALVAFTGGLLGPDGSDLRHPGSLDAMPILLSSGDPDPHVPWKRVEETANQFRNMGGSVHAKRYAGRPHTVVPEELQLARALFLPLFTISPST